jgi:hypothetical protein
MTTTKDLARNRGGIQGHSQGKLFPLRIEMVDNFRERRPGDGQHVAFGDGPGGDLQLFAFVLSGGEERKCEAGGLKVQPDADSESVKVLCGILVSYVGCICHGEPEIFCECWNRKSMCNVYWEQEDFESGLVVDRSHFLYGTSASCT